MKKNKLFKTLLSTAVIGMCLVTVTSCKEDKPDEDKPAVVVPEKKYTITFDSKGGTDVAKITDIESGKTANKPEDPTKDGYTFAGWYTDKYFNFQFDFSRDKIKGDWTLYAKWEADLDKELVDYKATKVAELNTYITENITKTEYTVNLEALEALITSSEAAINACASKELVDLALTSATTALSAIKTDAQEVANAKDGGAIATFVDYVTTTHADYVTSLIDLAEPTEEEILTAINGMVSEIAAEQLATIANETTTTIAAINNEIKLAIIKIDNYITKTKVVIEGISELSNYLDNQYPSFILNKTNQIITSLTILSGIDDIKNIDTDSITSINALKLQVSKIVSDTKLELDEIVEPLIEQLEAEKANILINLKDYVLSNYNGCITETYISEIFKNFTSVELENIKNIKSIEEFNQVKLLLENQLDIEISSIYQPSLTERKDDAKEILDNYITSFYPDLTIDATTQNLINEYILMGKSEIQNSNSIEEIKKKLETDMKVINDILLQAMKMEVNFLLKDYVKDNYGSYFTDEAEIFRFLVNSISQELTLISEATSLETINLQVESAKKSMANEIILMEKRSEAIEELETYIAEITPLVMETNLYPTFAIAIQYVPIEINSCINLNDIELELNKAKEELQLIIEAIDDELQTLLLISKYDFIIYYGIEYTNVFGYFLSNINIFNVEFTNILSKKMFTILNNIDIVFNNKIDEILSIDDISKVDGTLKLIEDDFNNSLLNNLKKQLKFLLSLYVYDQIGTLELSDEETEMQTIILQTAIEESYNNMNSSETKENLELSFLEGTKIIDDFINEFSINNI